MTQLGGFQIRDSQILAKHIGIPASDKLLYVDSGRNPIAEGYTPNGSENKPFVTLQSAITAVPQYSGLADVAPYVIFTKQPEYTEDLEVIDRYIAFSNFVSLVGNISFVSTLPAVNPYVTLGGILSLNSLSFQNATFTAAHYATDYQLWVLACYGSLTCIDVTFNGGPDLYLLAGVFIAGDSLLTQTNNLTARNVTGGTLEGNPCNIMVLASNLEIQGGLIGNCSVESVNSLAIQAIFGGIPESMPYTTLNFENSDFNTYGHGDGYDNADFSSKIFGTNYDGDMGNSLGFKNCTFSKYGWYIDDPLLAGHFTRGNTYTWIGPGGVYSIQVQGVKGSKISFYLGDPASSVLFGTINGDAGWSQVFSPPITGYAATIEIHASRITVDTYSYKNMLAVSYPSLLPTVTIDERTQINFYEGSSGITDDSEVAGDPLYYITDPDLIGHLTAGNTYTWTFGYVGDNITVNSINGSKFYITSLFTLDLKGFPVTLVVGDGGYTKSYDPSLFVLQNVKTVTDALNWLKDNSGGGFTPDASTTIYIDPNRTDTYTPDGTEIRPFKATSNPIIPSVAAQEAVQAAFNAYTTSGYSADGIPVEFVFAPGNYINCNGLVLTKPYDVTLKGPGLVVTGSFSFNYGFDFDWSTQPIIRFDGVGLAGGPPVGSLAVFTGIPTGVTGCGMLVYLSNAIFGDGSALLFDAGDNNTVYTNNIQGNLSILGGEWGDDLSKAWVSVTSLMDGMYVLAAPANGVIYLSSDYGNTWMSSGSELRGWAAVAATSTPSAVAVPSTDGHIYTLSGSLVWTEQLGSSRHNWSGVASSADGTKLVAIVYEDPDDKGYIYTSSDSGVSWTKRMEVVSGGWNYITSSADGMSLMALGTHGPGHASRGAYAYSFYSLNGGVDWAPTSPTRTGYPTQGLASSSDGTKLVTACSSTGRVYTSTDSGATWANAGSGSFNCFASSADGVKLVATVAGDYHTYTSIDSGASWTTGPDIGNITSCLCSDPGGTDLVAVSASGYIHNSRDSGVTWSEITGLGPCVVNVEATDSSLGQVGKNVFTYDNAKIMKGSNSEFLASAIIMYGGSVIGYGAEIHDCSFDVLEIRDNTIFTDCTYNNYTTIAEGAHISTDTSFYRDCRFKAPVTVSASTSMWVTQLSLYNILFDPAATVTFGGSANIYLDNVSRQSLDRVLAPGPTLVYYPIEVNPSTTSVTLVIDGAGAVILPGSKGFIPIPFNAVVTGWSIVSDVAGGAIQVDIKKCTYAAYPTTSSMTTGGTPPNITAMMAQKNQGDVTGWATTTITNGDYLEFYVDSAALITKATVSILLTRSS